MKTRKLFWGVLLCITALCYGAQFCPHAVYCQCEICGRGHLQFWDKVCFYYSEDTQFCFSSSSVSGEVEEILIGYLRWKVDWIIKCAFSPVKLEILLVLVFILFGMRLQISLKVHSLQLGEAGRFGPWFKKPRDHLTPSSAVTFPRQWELGLES